MSKTISGFSKLTKQEKISWLSENYFNNQPEIIETIQQGERNHQPDKGRGNTH